MFRRYREARDRFAWQLGVRTGWYVGVRLADLLWKIKPLRPTFIRWVTKGD